MNHSFKILKIAMIAMLLIMVSSCTDRVYIFEGVKGPMTASPLLAPQELGPFQFDTGETSRLAVLVTEETSHWLALSAGLKTIGIPFRMTKSAEEALKHDIVMVYPQITGLNMTPDELGALREFVENGGTLIGTNVLGGGLADLFGFQTISESKSRYQLDFSQDLSETSDFLDKGLSRIKIGSSGDNSINPGTNSYLRPKNPPIAKYENGEAAIVTHQYGQGKTYAFGVDLGQILSKGYNRRQVGISEHYANEYQPILDAWLILIENIYKNQNQPKAVLGTVPNGKTLSFMLTHDVDFSKSMRNAISYAAHQKEENVPATYFIQTKYALDYNDEIFFAEEAEEILGALENLGAEIGSHSVAHSNAMWEFDIGDGTEYYPEYTPFVRNSERTTGATLFGEVRVSKFLLDHFIDNQEVQSFRPGFLSNPTHMPQVLASAKYKYSSSVTANVSLTHLPFQLSYGREFSAFSNIFEFPITVEDEINAPMYGRVEQSKNLAKKIAKIEGSYVVLIHTDKVDSRLDFQKEILAEVKPYAWIGSVREFGDWWAARDKVEVDILPLTKDEYQISLNAPKPIKGLTLELNAPFEIVETTMDSKQLNVSGHNILILNLSGEQKIKLKR